MLRRNFLIAGAVAVAAIAQQKPDQKKPDEQKPEEKKADDTAVAGPTQDPTPRVGIILSSFKEGEDDDGTKIAGLSDPQPPDADLTPAQFDAWVRRAIDLGALHHSEVFEVIEPEDWIVVKTRPDADSRIVAGAISYLAEHKRGLRFTIIDRLAQGRDWAPEYRKMVADFSAKFPKVRFELVDLNSAPTADLPVADKPGVSYGIPKIVQQCDRLISVAPLATDAALGVSLSVGNYATIASKPVTTDEALIDVFSYRPADLAIVGGSFGTEGDGTPVHYNVLIAGMKAVAVDSVAAQVMGFKPADLPFLGIGTKRGFGSTEPDEIWARGNDIKAIRREFKKPSAWKH